MEYTTNYNLAKPEATDQINPLSREAYNDNLDVIDEKIKEASENGGIAVQEDEPTSTVLAWIDTDEEGADFCYVGADEPTNDGSVAIWIDTSEDFIPPTYDLTGVESRTLLWTNPSPSSNFNPQTISLDLSGYEAVEVTFKSHVNNKNGVAIKCYFDNNETVESGSCRALCITQTWSLPRSRAFFVGYDGVSFDNGYQSTDIRNEVAIPLKIYGIKKVVS